MSSLPSAFDVFIAVCFSRRIKSIHESGFSQKKRELKTIWLKPIYIISYIIRQLKLAAMIKAMIKAILKAILKQGAMKRLLQKLGNT